MSRKTATSVVNMPTTHENDLISSLRNIFGSSKYSDVTVRCGSDVYQLHRAIICPRSGFFAAACDSGFKESTTAVITLDDDDQPTVRRMLTYLYTLDYDDGDDRPATAVAAIQNTNSLMADPTSKPDVVDDAIASHCKRMNNIHVYVLADKYDIPALRELAKTKFRDHTATPNITHLREVINEIYESTPETDSGLRDSITSSIAKTKTLKSILKEGPLASAFRDHSSFGLGLLREVVKKHSKEQAKLKQLGSLHQDAVRICIPYRDDPDECFVSFEQALAEFQEKLLDFWNSVKQEE